MAPTPDAAVPTFAGVDGCPGGWLVATAGPAERGLCLLEVHVVPDFEVLLAATGACASIAVDIPIGLSEDGPRLADSLARARIGPRRSSVFPAPPRFALQARSYSDANAASWARFGRGLQKQVFNILPKIREADACLTASLQERIVESHPEVCFWAAGGETHLLWPKRTADGVAERLRRLEAIYGDSVRELTPPRGAARDDLYDACILAWTAARVAAGTAVPLPSDPQRDSRGLRMEIVY